MATKTKAPFYWWMHVCEHCEEVHDEYQRHCDPEKARRAEERRQAASDDGDETP